ncbi:AMP-binding protein [Methylobacterium sp. J-076]|uniref:AMP-binding protein n=1 Tax=Methylobacterium sp. J-076 TaxID=2836655 RepID=UPI001FB96CF3|nr:AMP-binding protein [Methylobacterium sp. J-076]MCJ2015083.1 acyl-CoA synthetase [Methylobacterium sp. J-076]
MSAHAAQFPASPAGESLGEGLARALSAAARLHPQRVLLRDAGDRRAWCGRPAITWTYEAAAEIVGRLTRGIGAWRLPPGSRIGLDFAGGAEASLAYLAVEAAGHVPCPLSPLWDMDALSAAIEGAGLAAILTEGRRGSRRPAEDVVLAALRHFGLRFIAAFGPGLPDGVISLDAMALERGVVAPQPGRGLVTFAAGDPRRPVRRGAASFGALVAAHRERLPTPERILTLLPPHDLRGLATGLGVALACSATLESVVPFDSATFRVSLVRPVPTRLVVPAAFEPALAETTLPWTVRAIDVVHRAPARLPDPAARDVAGPPRLDVLVLDEDVLLTRPRGRWDIPAEADAGDSPVARRRDGRILWRDAPSRSATSQCGTPGAAEDGAWTETAYRAGLSRGALTVFPAG